MDSDTRIDIIKDLLKVGLPRPEDIQWLLNEVKRQKIDLSTSWKTANILEGERDKLKAENEKLKSTCTCDLCLAYRPALKLCRCSSGT